MRQYALMSLLLAGVAAYYGKPVFGAVLVMPAVPHLLSVIFHVVLRFLPAGMQRFINRDLRAILISAKVYFICRSYSKRDMSAAKIFEQTVDKFPGKIAFKFNDKEWTFRQLDDYANQVAHYFQSQAQLKKGDCVALIATSCPQYLAIWLGLNKIGCVTSLINYNLKDEALRHSIKIAESKMVIIGSDLLPNYLRVMPDLKSIQRSLVFCEGDPSRYTGDLPCLDEEIAKMPTTRPDVANPSGYRDKLVYIYTSGTTGLPKPCIITSHRAFMFAALNHYLCGMKQEDVLLCTLPLYHSAGGLISCGQTLFMGLTIVMKKSFSASKFWDDVRKHKCTVFHYIGELCRYLLTQTPKPDDANNTLRLIFGVGLRAQIWPQFVSRFGIDHVVEWYGSTEGNAGFVNIDGKVGAVGFSSWLLEHAKKQWLIKVNMETGEPIRDETTGLCIECKADEPGELVGKITSSRFNTFDGYLQKDATVKKQLENVFQKGDLFFRSGDVLVKDEEGYVFFVDRTGDTFRWKGENVSTTEVEGIISGLIGNVDVGVFGVSIPDCEGKAGMACIAGSDTDIDIGKLSQNMQDHLTVYARPLFLRFQTGFQLTTTFKVMKSGLKEAGYDLKKCGQDRVYYWDPAGKEYRRLTPEVYDRICSGGIRY